MKHRVRGNAVATWVLVAGLLLALGLVVPPRAAGNPVGQALGPGQADDDLSFSAWRSIQAQVAKLTAADGAAQDEFGRSVSESGDTAVIGAVGDDFGGGWAQGSAYVFYRDQGDPGAWSQVAKLAAADGAPGDGLGYSVWVSDDTAVIGAVLADVGSNTDQGAAYVFCRDQGGPDAWGQVAKLTAADGAASDLFGDSVSVSGDTVVVGARQADLGGNSDQGAAYVFYRDQGGPDAWGEVAKLTAADGSAEDRFGVSVWVGGDTALIGAEGADVSGATDQGAAYVFYRDQDGPDAWGQVAELTATDGMESDHFGYSVWVSDDTAIIGAVLADVGGTTDQGAAYVFYRDQGGPDTWGQMAKLTAADGAAVDEFGLSVSVSGDTVVVGAFLADVGDNSDQGAAYVFSRDQGGPDAWGQVAKLTAADGSAEARFGVSVWVGGDTAFVGAYCADVGGNWRQGAAYVYGNEDLALAKAVHPGTTVLAGEPITFTLAFSYAGTVTATGVLISDVVPAEVTQVAFDSSYPVTPSGTVSYTWLLGDLPPGALGVITMTGVVSPGLPAGYAFTNTAIITATTVEWYLANNRDSVQVSIQAAPVAMDDVYSTTEDIPLAVATPGVLANDTDPNGDPLAAVLDSPPLSGTLVLNPDGSFTYTPTLDFTGVDAFTYHATDTISDSNVAKVTLTVVAANNPPLAMDDSYTTTEDIPLVVAAPGVLANDSDPDGDPLTALLDSPPVSGTLVLNPDGSFTYTPTLNIHGVDTFTYHATDTFSDSNVATVTIVVEPSPRHWIYLPLVVK